MQLSHGKGLSAAFYFFYGIEIMDVLLCLLQQMKVTFSRASVSEERMQGLWVRSCVQTRGYCPVCSNKKGKSWFLLRDKGAAEVSSILSASKAGYWRVRDLPEPWCSSVPGDHRGEGGRNSLVSLVSLVLSWAKSHVLKPLRGGVTSLPNVRENASSRCTSHCALQNHLLQAEEVSVQSEEFSRNLERHQEVGSFLSGTLS